MWEKSMCLPWNETCSDRLWQVEHGNAFVPHFFIWLHKAKLASQESQWSLKMDVRSKPRCILFFLNQHHYCFNLLKNYQLLQGQLSDPLQFLYAGLLPCFLATSSNLPSLKLIYGPPSPHPLLTGVRIKTDKSKPQKLLIRLWHFKSTLQLQAPSNNTFKAPHSLSFLSCMMNKGL